MLEIRLLAVISGFASSTCLSVKHISEKITIENGFEVISQHWSKIGELLTGEGCKDAHTSWFWRILNLYSDSRRFYHTNNHIIYMLKQLDSIDIESSVFFTEMKLFNIEYTKQNIEQFRSLIALCVFFHDCIYLPTSSKNEDVSADLLVEYCKETGIREEWSQKCKRIILMTKDH